MDVSSLNAATPPGLTNSRSTTQKGINLTAPVDQTAGKRVPTQVERESVELSSFGKLSSSFSEAQAASRALSNQQQTATDVGVRTAVRGFVKAFNLAAQTARSASASQGLLADDSSVAAAQSDLRRIVSADAAAASDLKNIGIRRQQDGTLAIDANKFDDAFKANPDAVRNTLSSIGQQVDHVTTRALGNSGNVGNSLISIGNRTSSLETRQTEQQADRASAQQLADTQTARSNNSVNTGVAAYQRIFSL